MCANNFKRLETDTCTNQIKKDDEDKFPGYTKVYDADGRLIRREKQRREIREKDFTCYTSNSDSDYYYVTKENVITYYNDGSTRESYCDGYVIKETDKDGNVTMLKEGNSPALRYDRDGNPIKPYKEFNVSGFEKRIDYLIDMYK